MKTLSFVIFYVAIHSIAQPIDNNIITLEKCQKWFEKTEIKPGKKCKDNCARVGLSYFMPYCSSNCDQLCENALIRQKTLFKLTELYPTLNDAERLIATKEPIKTLQAYKLSHEAESICLNIYPVSDRNDESDACRHFMWSALLYNNLEPTFAESVLNAHEEEPRQPKNEREMDLYNNLQGKQAYSRLKGTGSFSTEKLKEDFKKELSSKKLKVIKYHYATKGEKK